MNGPSRGESERKNSLDGCRLDDRIESLIEMNPGLLRKTTKSQGAIKMVLMPKNSFDRKDIGIWRRDKNPCVIGHKKFVHHS